jgi:uncharacterized membrane protein YjfL (UPF0719 family)
MAVLAVELVIAVFRIISALVFSAGALYSGMNLLDRLTPGIDEWKEIKKGNAALGILFAAVMISTFLIVEPRISDLLLYIQGDLPVLLTIKLITLMTLNYLAALFSGILMIYLTIGLIDRITPDLDELAELKKGNLAVAIILSVALILIIVAGSVPLETIFSIIKDMESTIV